MKLCLLLLFVANAFAQSQYSVFFNGGCNPQAGSNNITVNDVLSRGFLRCATVDISPDTFQTQNKTTGLDTLTCKAVAAAFFSDAGSNPNRVMWGTTTWSDRWSLLNSNNVDVIAGQSTNTIWRQSNYDASFSAITYYDGSFVIVSPTTNGVSNTETTLAQFKNATGKTVCSVAGTTFSNEIAPTQYPGLILNAASTTDAELTQLVSAGTTCNFAVQSTDNAQTLANAVGGTIISEPVNDEPLAPFVKVSNTDLVKVLNAVVNGAMAAELAGITKANVDQQANSSLFVGSQKVAPVLGLPTNYLQNVIKAVGNYGEWFTASSLARPTRSQLYTTTGGLVYPMPF